MKQLPGSVNVSFYGFADSPSNPIASQHDGKNDFRKVTTVCFAAVTVVMVLNRTRCPPPGTTGGACSAASLHREAV